MKSHIDSTVREDAPANSPAVSGLHTKRDVARVAKVSIRTVDQWMKAKRIPVVRLSARCVRFHLPSVLQALGRYTVEATSTK